MTDAVRTRRFFTPWRIAGWGLIVVLLSVPAILHFPWTAGDFIVMGILLGSVGLGIEFLWRRAGNAFVRLGCVLAVLTSFLTIWVNLAVGMIASEDNAYNQLFILPIFAALVGGFIVRLRPSAMALVMVTSGAIQLALGLGGLGTDQRGAIFSSLFSLLWLLAAALFRAGAKR